MIWDLIQSERSYVRALNIVVSVYTSLSHSLTHSLSLTNYLFYKTKQDLYEAS